QITQSTVTVDGGVDSLLVFQGRTRNLQHHLVAGDAILPKQLEKERRVVFRVQKYLGVHVHEQPVPGAAGGEKIMHVHRGAQEIQQRGVREVVLRIKQALDG